MQVWENPTAMPRAWVVHQVESWPDDEDRSTLEERFRHLLFPHNRPRDFRHSAVVESSSPVVLPIHDDRANETCRVVDQRACRVEVEATLVSPGLLVLSNQYDPGWSVDVMSNGSNSRPEIVRTNGVMQGVLLPAGAHRLVFRYAPRELYGAAGVSIVSWLLCLAFAVWQRVRGRGGDEGEGVYGTYSRATAQSKKRSSY